MSRIVVFGAGGTAGRRVVAEARSRGHEIVAVVRDPARHPGLDAVTGDVTDPASVTGIVKGADAVISTVYSAEALAAVLYRTSAEALVTGLAAAGVTRLVTVGVGTMLEVSPGVALHDGPDVPAEVRTFSQGHAAEVAVLEASDPTLDWVVLVPPPVMLDATAARTGHYRTGGRQVLAAESFSYADLAVALVDEAERPRHHREMVAVA